MLCDNSKQRVSIFKKPSILRILTSVYEAATFRFQEKCEEKQLVYQPIWFTYSVVIINLLLVNNPTTKEGMERVKLR